MGRKARLEGHWEEERGCRDDPTKLFTPIIAEIGKFSTGEDKRK